MCKRRWTTGWIMFMCLAILLLLSHNLLILLLLDLYSINGLSCKGYFRTVGHCFVIWNTHWHLLFYQLSLVLKSHRLSGIYFLSVYEWVVFLELITQCLLLLNVILYLFTQLHPLWHLSLVLVLLYLSWTLILLLFLWLRIITMLLWMSTSIPGLIFCFRRLILSNNVLCYMLSSLTCLVGFQCYLLKEISHLKNLEMLWLCAIGSPCESPWML